MEIKLAQKDIYGFGPPPPAKTSAAAATGEKEKPKPFEFGVNSSVTEMKRKLTKRSCIGEASVTGDY